MGPLRRTVAVLLAAAIPALSFADQLPQCVTRWVKRADTFLAVKPGEEGQYKAALKKEMALIYAGDELAIWQDWVDGGHTESDYYDAVLQDLKDTHYGPMVAKGVHGFETSFNQSSCYYLSIDGPGVENIVRDYKVSNLSQQQVDAWFEKLAKPDEAQVCIEVTGTEALTLDPKDQRIVDVKRARKNTNLQLKPE